MAERVASRGGRLLRGGAAVAAPVLVAAGLVVGGGTGVPAPSTTRSPAVEAPVGSVAAPAGRPGADSRADPPAPSPAHSPADVRAGGLRPRTVVVPALGISAAVDPITVAGGTLTPPADPLRVGWWSGGARPGGQRGTAVVTGHTVHTGGGAFDRLEELAPGDRVLVAAGAREVRYEVASVRVLSRDALARRHRSLFRQEGSGRLVLVTCEDWDGTAYRSNVVVVARPV